MKLRFSITLVYCLFVNTVIGQYIQYYPENPTWEDTITVICGIGYLDSPCQLLGTDLINEGMEYTARVCHYEGNLSMPCWANDTFRIKVPDYSPGVYSFSCQLGINHSAPSDFDCAFSIVQQNGDTLLLADTVLIPVSDPLSISERSDIQFQLSPNPASHHVSIQVPPGNFREAFLSDMLGRLLGSFAFNGTQRMELDLSSFSNGIYLVEVMSDDGRRGVQRLVVQH
jgi:hypothetical protein